MSMATEHCPWCDSVIPHERFVQIQKKIRQEEQRKLAAAKEEIRSSIEKEMAGRFSIKEQKLAADQQKLAQKHRALDAERTKIVQERQSFAASAKRQVEAAKEAAEKQYKKDLAVHREALQKDKNDALVK